ncbi:MAG: hypothetical protein M3Q97_10190 [Bacteroidota bacterium]|nr:hypothetical protein [Bacteroidota bacterium]
MVHPYVFPGLKQVKGAAKSAEEIIKIVAEEFDVEIQDIFSKSRKQLYCVPRQLIMYLLRERMGLSFVQISNIFHVHHTTVIHACHTVKEDHILHNPQVQGLILSLPPLKK